MDPAQSQCCPPCTYRSSGQQRPPGRRVPAASERIAGCLLEPAADVSGEQRSHRLSAGRTSREHIAVHCSTTIHTEHRFLLMFRIPAHRRHRPRAEPGIIRKSWGTGQTDSCRHRQLSPSTRGDQQQQGAQDGDEEGQALIAGEGKGKAGSDDLDRAAVEALPGHPRRPRPPPRCRGLDLPRHGDDEPALVGAEVDRLEPRPQSVLAAHEAAIRHRQLKRIVVVVQSSDVGEGLAEDDEPFLLRLTFLLDLKPVLLHVLAEIPKSAELFRDGECLRSGKYPIRRHGSAGILQ